MTPRAARCDLLRHPTRNGFHVTAPFWSPIVSGLEVHGPATVNREDSWSGPLVPAMVARQRAARGGKFFRAKNPS